MGYRITDGLVGSALFPQTCLHSMLPVPPAERRKDVILHGGEGE